ncbi:short-chain dehydrogenase/reductase SDR [Acidimicrobium ferrooxidans DSM 10331]|uniref:Short-chain dehydrogenase/reductase SDR n=1 Tax=Acidimicrobium ferrooxidans (strain DSM 10331 / JCM 15462 / NBRC 103882 / ICP) TaxID=525909 RepID=C7LY57_ACIFD|nr:SDR family NAD(P)-dependent oxidoreductase [Acidimicrobium ferrooxidans]ACU53665.1 short-chain dehydrogenase/reductase SDR [Acidimicrobium ferrooxidans DSM 10331]
MELRGSSVVVTGGASGLGLGVAERLIGRGAHVVIVDRNAEAGAAVAARLSAEFVEADVTDEEQLARAFDRAAALGPVRMGVACAGIGIAERVLGRSGEPHQLASFQRVIGVNLIGTFNLLRLAARAIGASEPADGERGVIVLTASIAAFDGQIGQIAYAASKGGVVGMTLPAARDLASAQIRVVTIAPGIMDTPLLGQLPEEVRRDLGASIPFPKRLGQPADFAQLVEAIAENHYLNGEVIRLDGALRMPPR